MHVAVASANLQGWLQNEGLAAWLGGSRGRSPTQLFRLLVSYQAAHPGVTFAALMRGEVSVAREAAATSDARYASGALAFDAVYRRSGVAGVRALAAVPDGGSVLLAALARQLGLGDSGDALERWWHAAARAAAARPVRGAERDRVR